MHPTTGSNVSTIAREGTLMMQQEEFGVLSFPGLGETALFGGAWQKYWVKLSAQALSFADSATGEGGTIPLQDILAVMPEDVEGVSCLMLKVKDTDGADEICHRLRALPDENGHDSELLQEWKMSILMSVENWHQQHDSFANGSVAGTDSTNGSVAASEAKSLARQEELQSANKALEQKSEDCAAELGALKVAHAQAEHDQMEMVAKLEEMREREVSEIESQLKEMEQKLQQANENALELQQASSAESDNAAEVQQLQEKLNQLEEDSAASELAAECNTRKLDDAVEAQQAAEAVAVGLRTKIASLQELHEGSAKAQQLDEQRKLVIVREEAASSFQAIKEEMEQYKTKCSELQAQVEAQAGAQSVAPDDQQLTGLQTQLEASQEENLMVEEKNEALSSEISTLEYTLKQAELQAATLSDDKGKLEEKLVAAERDNKGLLRQVDELESLLLEQDDDEEPAGQAVPSMDGISTEVQTNIKAGLIGMLGQGNK